MRACPDTWPNFDTQYLGDRPIRAHHQIARLYLGYRGGFRAIKSPRADRLHLGLGAAVALGAGVKSVVSSMRSMSESGRAVPRA
jgi:hypothetical protein